MRQRREYDAGRNYPQADVLFALMELYEADFRELLWEQLTHCRFSKDGCWVISAIMRDWPELLLEVALEPNAGKNKTQEK